MALWRHSAPNLTEKYMFWQFVYITITLANCFHSMSSIIFKKNVWLVLNLNASPSLSSVSFHSTPIKSTSKYKLDLDQYIVLFSLKSKCWHCTIYHLPLLFYVCQIAILCVIYFVVIIYIQFPSAILSSS